MYYELTDRFRVPADVDRTWAFFSSAGNLATITPPWLAFTVHTPDPIEMRQGTILDYTIRWLNVPVRWRTRIIDFSPPHQFIDLQIRGPYTLWHHQHRFEQRADGGGVECSDSVIYKLPAGPLGTLTHAAVVRSQLLEIFRYRRGRIGEALGGATPVQDDVRIARIS